MSTPPLTCFVVQACATALAAGPRSNDDRFWILATMWEAAVGSGDTAAAGRFKDEIEKLAAPNWMLESTYAQLAHLESLLAASPLNSTSQPRLD